VIAFFGGITAFLPIHDAYLQTFPDIRLANMQSDSSPIVSFTIKNGGGYFGMTMQHIVCSLDRPYMQIDREHHETWFMMPDILSLSERRLAPGDSFIYKCDPHILIQGFDKKGSMPDRLNIRLYISVVYKLHTLLHDWPRRHSSPVFSCELTRDQSRCIEGDILNFWMPRLPDDILPPR
jgi:hypothetical protein